MSVDRVNVVAMAVIGATEVVVEETETKYAPMAAQDSVKFVPGLELVCVACNSVQEFDCAT